MPLAAAFVLAVGGSALAGAVTVEPGLVQARFNGSFSPGGLSKKEQTPVVFRAETKFKTIDGSSIPALEEFTVGIDRHARLNLKGIPVCRGGGREVSSLPAKCKEALVGIGEMEVFFHFQDPPIPTRNSLAIYKTAPHDGVTLAAVTELKVPVPRQVVIPIAVEDGRGRYGLELVASVPKLAGGAGSVLRLELRFHKGVFSATCPDHHLDAHFDARFVDGTALSGASVRACTGTISG